MRDNAVSDTAPRSCPFHHSGTPAAMMSPTGCPVSAEAAAFDVFGAPYQFDPAEALRWARAQEGVFYSPKMDYWVVSRYDDVKAVFRDNVTFSPSNALEKVTPSSPEAMAVLASYNYAMNRTLVNEDEPHHMARRRALMRSFVPEELARHEPMVRQLTREFVGRFVDKGHADLVNEMLWEVPLTVALHFLGIPQEDMGLLRRYSIAHTANTWGRPTPDQQLAVAEAVGRFWQFSGQVLDRMRADPSGHGWMHYAIRQQQVLPDVVTNSYLHSMMMAGLVAAHETTAHAAANALRLLLTHREAWDEICADPALIPNAVEECLRLAGSIVAWRRVALEDTAIGGVAIPKGGRILIVSTSANHDESHFENPDELDIFRDNTTDHLSFGYGSHQCMGKNMARMEIRVFLEELTKRLPHMDLVKDQIFEYLPNMSFRGPDHLYVSWDPAKNPERRDPAVLERHTPFVIGAPLNRTLARPVRVAEVCREADGVARITLEDLHGRVMPSWSPGAHIDVVAGDHVRKYSLCGDAADRRTLQIAVLRDPAGRGGSVYIHDAVRAGDLIRIRGPKNYFRLDETADDVLLIAGGIGITPVIAMADRLKRLGRTYAINYTGRSRRAMAFLDRLQHDHGHRLTVYAKDEGQRLDLSALVAARGAGTCVYACGPERLLTPLAALMSGESERLRVEHFSSAEARRDARRDTGFDVELQDTKLAVHVAAGETLLQALRGVGIDLASDCEEGLCGSCEVHVLNGEIDHRDKVLSKSERAGQSRMIACCSRAKTGKLVLAL
jgi:cytochrome P450/ferredoxin-NADP reductase